MHINGSCHCAFISFGAEIDPSRVMLCHCTDCQVLSGSPFRAVVAASIGSFVVRGQPKSYGERAFAALPSQAVACCPTRRSTGRG